MTSRRITKAVLALFSSPWCLHECTHRKGANCPKTHGDPCPHADECLHEFKLMTWTHTTNEGIKEYYECTLCPQKKVVGDGPSERTKWRLRNKKRTTKKPNWRMKAIMEGLV